MPQLYSQWVSKPVHGKLVFVFGIENQEVHLVLFDELFELAKVMSLSHDLLHRKGQALRFQHLATRSDVILGFFQQLLQNFPTAGISSVGSR